MALSLYNKYLHDYEGQTLSVLFNVTFMRNECRRYYKTILFHGHEISYIDYNGHVRGHLKLWISNCMQFN